MDKIPFTELTGTRLVLKPHKDDKTYAERLYNMIRKNYNHLHAFMLQVAEIKDLNEEWDFLKSSVIKWNNGEEANFAIYLRNTDEIIGCIGVFNIDFTTKECEIGYWLDQNNTGHGYMQEAVKTVESYFFAKGIDCIFIKTDSENVKSQNIALKQGYKYRETKDKIAEEPSAETKTSAQSHKKEMLFAKLKSDWIKQR